MVLFLVFPNVKVLVKTFSRLSFTGVINATTWPHVENIFIIISTNAIGIGGSTANTKTAKLNTGMVFGSLDITLPKNLLVRFSWLSFTGVINATTLANVEPT